MSAIDGPLDSIRTTFRKGATLIARALNRLSGGKITPDAITYTSLLGHIPIALLIVTEHLILAGILLIIFGLLDTVDGALARLQKRASPAGMLLDASTDRMKESILYIAIAYLLIHQGHPYGAVWAVAACAGAIIVSYVKAKGETAMATAAASHATINHMFEDGLMRYEIRMFVLIVGLVTNQLLIAVVILAFLAWYTAFQRLFSINKYLKDHVST